MPDVDSRHIYLLAFKIRVSRAIVKKVDSRKNIAAKNVDSREKIASGKQASEITNL